MWDSSGLVEISKEINDIGKLMLLNVSTLCYFVTSL